MTQTIFVTLGLPASGKSSWAKEVLKDYFSKGKKITRVNRDDLRAMLHLSEWSKDNEKIVVATQDFIIRRALGAGHDVMIDDTNLHPSNIARFKSQALPFKAVVEIVSFLKTPLTECIRRDSLREGKARVGEEVIMRMYNQYLRNTA